MKKRLLFGSPQFSLRGLSYRITVLLASILFNLQSSFAQQWSVLGNEAQISSVAAFYTSITVLDDVPYVAYVETSANGGAAKVKRKNFGTGAWDQVGASIASNATYTKIYSDKNNKLYVTYIDVTGGSKLAVVTFNTTTQVWEPLVSGNPYVSAGSATHTAGASNIRSGLTFDNTNIPYVAFSERTSTTGYPYVKRFVSGSWGTLGGAAISTD